MEDRKAPVSFTAGRGGGGSVNKNPRKTTFLFPDYPAEASPGGSGSGSGSGGGGLSAVLVLGCRKITRSAQPMLSITCK
ncbi:hypothetical protein HPP92_022048 [Vanilla planifolia]|uniref:Uncharacterized protein n=1 Tax=Vanilla planifolia TaxID=51239 RepID=A0A835PUU3_VANPL|nr:hypothetical protein HPP92_021964 [Vanilla planifolia]KAG0458920.1 hypothetical protein HPP92_022048 [Vanilla planifolia]